MRKTIVILAGTTLLLAAALAVAEEAPTPQPDLAALTAACAKGDKRACAAAEKLHLELAEKLRADIARLTVQTPDAGEEVEAERAGEDPGRMAKVDDSVVALRKKELEKHAISALIGTAGDSDSLVGATGVLSSEVDAAFAGTSGVVRKKGSSRSAEIKKPRDRDEVGGLEGKSGGAVGGGSRKAQKKVRAMTSLKVATGGRAGNPDIAKTLRRRMSAMKTCYELLLKRDPQMPGGRVDVALTIGKSGRVVESDITRNATGSAELATCIKSKLKRFRFKPPEEELETSFSITFKSN
jgi:hypothetical protein